MISLLRCPPRLSFAMVGKPLGYSNMAWAGDLEGAAIKKENTPGDLSTLGMSLRTTSAMNHKIIKPTPFGSVGIIRRLS